MEETLLAGSSVEWMPLLVGMTSVGSAKEELGTEEASTAIAGCVGGTNSTRGPEEATVCKDPEADVLEVAEVAVDDDDSTDMVDKWTATRTDGNDVADVIAGSGVDTIGANGGDSCCGVAG